MTTSSSAFADPVDSELASDAISEAVETSMAAGVPTHDIVVSLLAFASTVARSTDDLEFWQPAFHRAAAALTEGGTDGR